MNYYERHVGDYLKDTAHLSLLEHGVYTRLLDVYYTREGGIPTAEAARLVGARSKDERAALVSVLGEYFKLVDGLHSQDRCEREIARFHDKQAKAKASADARWSKSERNANAFHRRDAADMRTHSERNADGMPRAPVPSPQSPDSSNQTPVCESTHMPDGYPEVLKSRPELDPNSVWAGFIDHYPADKRTLTKWTKWVAREQVVAAVAPMSDPDSRASIEALGVARGLGKWDELRERFREYKNRVRATA